MFNMKARLYTWSEAVSASYWFVPTLMAVGAIILSTVMVWLDANVGNESLGKITWLYTGTADGARTLLGVIASSMVGLAGVVFSITIVALTLASGQFGAFIAQLHERQGESSHAGNLPGRVYLLPAGSTESARWK